jgi:hypothetical protein
MGHFNPNDDSQIVQSFTLGRYGFWGTPAYSQGRVYVVVSGDPVKAYQLSNGALLTPPIAQSDVWVWSGAAPAVSSSGATNGLVWAVDTNQYPSGPAILLSFSTSWPKARTSSFCRAARPGGKSGPPSRQPSHHLSRPFGTVHIAVALAGFPAKSAAVALSGQIRLRCPEL